MMDIAERVDSILGIALILCPGQHTSTLGWTEEHGNRVLTVKALGKTWSVCARAEPRDAAEDMCTGYLLRKMAHAAHVCPRCLERVPRAGSDGNNKARRKRYRCPGCLHSWQDS